MDLLLTKEFNGVALDCYKADNADDGFWVTREQVGRLLEYSEPMKSIAKIHERKADRLDKFSTIVKLTTVEGNRTVTRDVIVYNFKGFLEICRYSNQPKANAVMDFAWSIMDEIRKHGSYAAKSMTPAEMLLEQAKLLVEHERKISELSDSMADVDDRVRALEAKSEPQHCFSIMGYANFLGLRLSLSEARRLGKSAASLSRERGYTIDRVREPRYGFVNIYHEDILSDAFASEFVSYKYMQGGDRP